MAAFVKSVETISTTISDSASLQTVTVNLSKGQDETKCVPFYSIYFTSAGSDDIRNNNFISVEMVDNSGTPAARIRRQGGGGTNGSLSVVVHVVEFGSNVTVQQGGPVSLTGSSATATISSVTQANAFVVFNQHAASTSGSDDWNDSYVQASFNSDTEIAFERRSSGNPDWEIYWYVVESDGVDFQTEYVEVSWTSSQTGPTNQTLSNSVTLANAFIICSYETAELSDDPRDAFVNFALTGTTTLTWYRNHGGSPSASGTYGVWVVRSDSDGCAVQRFATDVDGALTNDQSITEVDADKAVVIPSQNVGGPTYPITSTTSGGLNSDLMTQLDFTSTTNVRLIREATTSPAGSNNNVRFEVIEFELESEGPAPIERSALDGLLISDDVQVTVERSILIVDGMGFSESDVREQHHLFTDEVLIRDDDLVQRVVTRIVEDGLQLRVERLSEIEIVIIQNLLTAEIVLRVLDKLIEGAVLLGDSVDLVIESLGPTERLIVDSILIADRRFSDLTRVTSDSVLFADRRIFEHCRHLRDRLLASDTLIQGVNRDLSISDAILLSALIQTERSLVEFDRLLVGDITERLREILLTNELLLGDSVDPVFIDVLAEAITFILMTSRDPLSAQMAVQASLLGSTIDVEPDLLPAVVAPERNLLGSASGFEDSLLPALMAYRRMKGTA